MPATFVKGDFINELPKGEPRAFACPVDVSGRTDAGIASAAAKRWPGFGAWWAEQRKQIGEVAVFEADRDVIFALAILRGQKRGKLGWLDRAVRAMLAEAVQRGITHVNVPRLWGGPSGLDGARAKRIIEDAALAMPIEVTVFEQFIRAEPAAEPAPAEAIPKPGADGSATSTPKKAAPKKKAASPAKKKAASAPAKKKAASAPAKKKAASPAKKKAAK